MRKLRPTIPSTSKSKCSNSDPPRHCVLVNVPILSLPSYRWYIPITYQTDTTNTTRAWFKNDDLQRKIDKLSTLCPSLKKSHFVLQCWSHFPTLPNGLSSTAIRSVIIASIIQQTCGPYWQLCSRMKRTYVLHIWQILVNFCRAA